MTGFLDHRPKPVRSLSRFLAFALIVVIGASGLTARLFYLQIVDGGRLATLAVHNRTVIEAIQSSRGLIYDRTSRPPGTNAQKKPRPSTGRQRTTASGSSFGQARIVDSWRLRLRSGIADAARSAARSKSPAARAWLMASDGSPCSSYQALARR